MSVCKISQKVMNDFDEILCSGEGGPRNRLAFGGDPDSLFPFSPIFTPVMPFLFDNSSLLLPPGSTSLDGDMRSPECSIWFILSLLASLHSDMLLAVA